MNNEHISYEEYKNRWIEKYVLHNKNNKSLSTVEIGNRFGRYLTDSFFNLNSETKVFIKSDGANDGGIDFAFIDENNEDGGTTFHIIQSKYGTSYQGMDTIFEELNKFCDTLLGYNKLSDKSNNIIKMLNNFITGEISNEDKIQYTLETVDKLTEKDERASQRIKTIFQNVFGDKINFDVQCVSLHSLYYKIDDIDMRKFKISINTNIIPSGKNEYLCFVSLKNFYKFLMKYKEIDNDISRLYSKNVRGYLGAKNTKTNKNIKIIKTLNDEPQNFASFNNGIVVVVEDIKKSETTMNEFELIEPYVVNGCQTSSCIYIVLGQKYPTKQSMVSHPINDDIYENSFVVIKIIRVENDEILNRITRYANTQNRVTEKDLVGLENKSPQLRRIKNNLFKNHKIFVEIQGGSWKLIELENKEDLYNGGHTSMHELLKIYTTSIFGKCGMANKQNLPQTPSEKEEKKGKDGIIEYKKTNNVYSVIVDYNKFSSIDAYAMFKLSELGSNKEYFVRGIKKQSRVGTRFLFYSIFVEVLKRIFGDRSLIENYNDYFFSDEFRKNKIETDDEKIIKIFNKNRKITKIITSVFYENNKDILKYVVDKSLFILDNYIPETKEEGDEFSIYYEKDMLRDEVSRFLKKDGCNNKAEKLVVNLRLPIDNKIDEFSKRLTESYSLVDDEII